MGAPRDVIMLGAYLPAHSLNSSSDCNFLKKKKLLFFLTFIFVCVGGGGVGVCALAEVGIRGQLWGVSLSFHYVGSWVQTQIVRVVGKQGPLPTEPPQQPRNP